MMSRMFRVLARLESLGRRLDRKAHGLTLSLYHSRDHTWCGPENPVVLQPLTIMLQAVIAAPFAFVVELAEFLVDKIRGRKRVKDQVLMVRLRTWFEARMQEARADIGAPAPGKKTV